MRKFILAVSLLCVGATASAQAPTQPFGPTDAEIQEAVRQPGEPAPMRFTFTQLVLGAQEEEHQPPEDGQHRNNNQPIEFFPALPVETKFEPSFVAGPTCGMIILVAGIVGWVGLGLAVVVVETRQTKT